MKRLGFADFHDKHFGPEQRARWQSMLQQQQLQPKPQRDYSQNQQQEEEDYYNHNDTSDFEEDIVIYQEGEPEEEVGFSEDDAKKETANLFLHDKKSRKLQSSYVKRSADIELSKEAIEIFRFSEAYRKEREAEKLQKEQEEQDERQGMDDWQYDESSVLVSGGIEAPATSLVLTKKLQKEEEKSISSKIAIQEQLLNSAYLSTCAAASSGNNAPVILWPVLPFKM